MPSPFPGMDPFLEVPELWPDAHHGLITTIQELLNKKIRPRYVARVEERVYMDSEDEPDRFTWMPDVNVESQPFTGTTPQPHLKRTEQLQSQC